MRVLGVDPGSRVMGYGIIDVTKNYSYVTSGCIKVGDLCWAQRLETIYRDLTHLILEYCPQVAAIEDVFVHKNPRAALKLGQARGAAIVAIACNGLPLHEFSARSIKQAVVGYGNAQKEQVQHMIKTLLSLNKSPMPDAADALAIAMCYANHQRYTVDL